MATQSRLTRMAAVAAIGMMVFGASTLASAATSMAQDFTFTSRANVASPQMSSSARIVNPASRVSLNPQPLPPKQQGSLSLNRR